MRNVPKISCSVSAISLNFMVCACSANFPLFSLPRIALKSRYLEDTCPSLSQHTSNVRTEDFIFKKLATVHLG